MSIKSGIEVNNEGDFVVSQETMSELLDFLDGLEKSMDSESGRKVLEEIQPASFGSKQTYCCRMGHANAPDQERQQFRSYSWQAPLFCIRMARGKGWSTGSVSRGECAANDNDN